MLSNINCEKLVMLKKINEKENRRVTNNVEIILEVLKIMNEKGIPNGSIYEQNRDGAHERVCLSLSYWMVPVLERHQTSQAHVEDREERREEHERTKSVRISVKLKTTSTTPYPTRWGRLNVKLKTRTKNLFFLK